jgi:hypothetical protein
MQTLSQQQISQVSGGEGLVAAIHRNEWNNIGVPLVNTAIIVYNLAKPAKPVPLIKPIPKPTKKK